MFVVRIATDANGPDFDVFKREAPARARYDALWLQTHLGEIDSIALFQVSAVKNARDAIAAVKREACDKVDLLALKEPNEIEMGRWTSDISRALQIDE